MGTCWWCHWGWPKQIADIFAEARARLGDDDYALLYGPAHIVWADENWDSAQTCIDYVDNGKYCDGLTEKQKATVRWSLVELLKVPEEFLSEPEEYDGYDPHLYPPPDGWEMVKV